MASLPRDLEDAQPKRCKREPGFTLIELVVAISLLALLAGASAPLAMQQIRSNRLRTTQERMRELVVAMVGDPKSESFGFVGDMGALPAVLSELNTLGVQTPATIDPGDGISRGWAGPYIEFAGANGTAYLDAWGNPFLYVGTAQITSNGPDGQAATGDELVYPSVAPVTSGSVTVILDGVANDGRDCGLDDTRATVLVFSSVAGTRTATNFSSSLPGVFVPAGAGLAHNGLHGVVAAGINDWAGSTSASVAVVRRSTAVVNLTLYQPAGPAPGCP